MFWPCKWAGCRSSAHSSKIVAGVSTPALQSHHELAAVRAYLGKPCDLDLRLIRVRDFTRAIDFSGNGLDLALEYNPINQAPTPVTRLTKPRSARAVGSSDPTGRVAYLDGHVHRVQVLDLCSRLLGVVARIYDRLSKVDGALASLRPDKHQRTCARSSSYRHYGRLHRCLRRLGASTHQWFEVTHAVAPWASASSLMHCISAAVSCVI